MFFKNVKELVKTGYFLVNQEFKLELKDGIVDEIIDSHTHLGWSYFVAQPIDLFKKSKTNIFFQKIADLLLIIIQPLTLIKKTNVVVR